LALQEGRFHIDISETSGSAKVGLIEPSIDEVWMQTTSTGKAHVLGCQPITVWANLFVAVEDEGEAGNVFDEDDVPPEKFVENLVAHATPNPKKRVRFTQSFVPEDLSEDLQRYHALMSPFYESITSAVNDLSQQATFLLNSMGKPTPHQLAPNLWTAADDLERRLEPTEADLTSMMHKARLWDQAYSICSSHASAINVLNSNIHKVNALAGAALADAKRSREMAGQLDLVGLQSLSARVKGLEDFCGDADKDLGLIASEVDALRSLGPTIGLAPQPQAVSTHIHALEQRIQELERKMGGDKTVTIGGQYTFESLACCRKFLQDNGVKDRIFQTIFDVPNLLGVL
jgi:hypothetical protein